MSDYRATIRAAFDRTKARYIEYETNPSLRTTDVEQPGEVDGGIVQAHPCIICGKTSDRTILESAIYRMRGQWVLDGSFHYMPVSPYNSIGELCFPDCYSIAKRVLKELVEEDKRPPPPPTTKRGRRGHFALIRRDIPASLFCRTAFVRGDYAIRKADRRTRRRR